MKFFNFYVDIFSIRKRPSDQITSEETTHRLMLNRDWAKHKHKQHRQEITFISRALKSQENALQQLKMENEELYEKALQVRTYSSMMKRLAYLG
jgi:large subunit ribosomal protein L40